MKVTIEIPEGEDYIPFIEFLERRHLLANRSEENEAVEDLLNIFPIIDKSYGLFPNVFKIDQFYEVVMSWYVSNNYGFFQATELRDAKGQDIVVNNEHDQFLATLTSLRNEVDHFPRLRSFSEGLVQLNE